MALNVMPTAVPLDLGPIDLPLVVAQQNLFDDLVELLKEALGPSSGLTSADVNVNFLARLMKLYDSRDRNWSKYAFGDRSRGYTRNLVDEGNGKSNLVSRKHRIKALVARNLLTAFQTACACLVSWKG